MNSISLLFFVLCALCGQTHAAETEAAPEKFARPELLASVDFVAKWVILRDPKVVLIDARNSDSFAQGHISGARNIQSDLLQEPEKPPYFMPDAANIEKTCANAGINPDSHVIIYDDEDGRLAARVWFTLHAYGQESVSILDGGLTRWAESGQKLSAETPAAGAGTFKAAATLRGTCAFSDLPQYRIRGAALGKLPAVTLLDARSLSEYMGDDTRTKNSGHIPGAANIEWSALMSGAERARSWRSPPEIYAILKLSGVERDQKIAIYDQAGSRSAHLYFTLSLMGFEKIANYTAGWREYGNRDDVEVEK